MGFLHVRDDFISCGPIKKGDKLRLDVSFENYTDRKWSRMVTEYRYHSRKSYKIPKLTESPQRKSCKRFVALKNMKRGLYDNYSRFITFKYGRVNTNIMKNVIWCSLLKIKVGDVEDFIGVIADIERPLLTLSENAASDNFLLMNYTSVIRLNLKNHSRISASFTWIDAIGDDSSSFDCKFVPSTGVIRPHVKWQILVYLKPLELITVKDLH
ncbi:uncharacterized protein LOC120356171 [Nilaparvata lugens]|uniref:uncharacterized protein LOC120356171 n=1 Tax=Nilaparvata lugens TaxID=108931 RepID=UPI00193CD481|nr:uncharacterized protein LOC120356171 [Nilaparvata lugens]